MTETTEYTPHPGSRLDAVAQAALHEAPAAVPAQAPAGDFSHVVPVRTDMPEECIPRTLQLSAQNPYLPILPRDMRRRRAVLLAISNDVVLCETRELAQQAATAASSSGLAASVSAIGTATDPAANVAVATTGSLPAGTYTITATVFLSGTVTSADASNMYVFAGSAGSPQFTDIAYPGVANVPATVTFTAVLGAATTIAVKAIANASGASAVYNASIVATPVAPVAMPGMGSYLPRGVPVVIESRDVMYAAAVTTVTPSPVAVVVERYAEG